MIFYILNDAEYKKAKQHLDNLFAIADEVGTDEFLIKLIRDFAVSIENYERKVYNDK